MLNANKPVWIFSAGICLMMILSSLSLHSSETQDLDARVRLFLEKHQRQWRDMNVPEADGQVLYDLILKNKYTKALEIGTSTGHSGIWLAWALSKTGGKLLTIEVNEQRYRQALTNFEEAGLSDFIDAHLADAHELVPQLEGPFDFVFCDADKNWYKNYLIAVLPKLEIGGCYTAHNVAGGRMRGIQEYLDYLQGLKCMQTTINRASWSGLSISYKKKISPLLISLVPLKVSRFMNGTRNEASFSWRSGGQSGIIWLWPGTSQVLIRNIDFSIIWYGYPNIGNEFCKAK